jgi:hypothetical protein
LSARFDNGKAFHMSEDSAKNMSSAKAREERLAAKLRENLRRRKAQARALGDSDSTQTLPKPRDAG